MPANVHLLNGRREDAPLRSLSALARSTPAYRLCIGELDEALDLIETLATETAA